jgi:hypothetical protein
VGNWGPKAGGAERGVIGPILTAQLDTLDPANEIIGSGTTPEFTIGHRFEANYFFEGDQFADTVVLGLFQLFGRYSTAL